MVQLYGALEITQEAMVHSHIRFEITIQQCFSDCMYDQMYIGKKWYIQPLVSHCLLCADIFPGLKPEIYTPNPAQLSCNNKGHCKIICLLNNIHKSLYFFIFWWNQMPFRFFDHSYSDVKQRCILGALFIIQYTLNSKSSIWNL